MRAKQINTRRIASMIYRRAGCRAGDHVAPSELAALSGVSVRTLPSGVSCDAAGGPTHRGWEILVHPNMRRPKRERVIGEMLADSFMRFSAATDTEIAAVGDELLRRWRSKR